MDNYMKLEFNNTIFDIEQFTEKQWLDLLSEHNIKRGILNAMVYNDHYKLAAMHSLDSWLLYIALINEASVITKNSKLQTRLAELIIDNKIPMTALTRIISPNNGSTLYWFLGAEARQAVIINNSALQTKIAQLIIDNKIPVAALTQLLSPSNDSAFYWLLATKTGQAIITNNPLLQAKLAKLIINNEIPVTALTQLVSPDNDSAFSGLLSTEAGQAIIINSSKLQTRLARLIINNKIPVTILCGLDKNNYSVLFYLFNTLAGKATLNNNPKLGQKIDALTAEYETLATETEKLFNEKLESNFPNFNKLVAYIYGPRKGIDKIEQHERERRINAFEDKFNKDQLQVCSITLGTITLPIMVAFAGSEKYSRNYELTAFIDYIKQTNIKNIGTITGNFIASTIYQQLYQNFDSNQVIDLSEYSILDPGTKSFVASMVFDRKYVEKFYMIAKDLKIVAEIEWLNDQINALTIRCDNLNKEIPPSIDLKNDKIRAKMRELSELITQKELYLEHKKALKDKHLELKQLADDSENSEDPEAQMHKKF